MKAKMLLVLFTILLLLPEFSYTQFNKISLNGTDHYINGVNIPWNNYGWDFGRHHTWGSGYNATWFESAFTDLEAAGVNTIRLWVHCDGRANPNFDENGFVTGLDYGMLDQLEEVIERANHHSLMVIIVLWSHDMFEDNQAIGGRFAGKHSDLVKEIEKTNTYLEKALTPIVLKLREHCNILAWEIMNEPEWGMRIADGDATEETVSVKEMQLFIGRCIQTIREHSDQNITVGSAIPFGNVIGQNKNYWRESEFHQLGFDCDKVYLDFYSFHFYEWMEEYQSPFEENAATWELGKPVLIAETATSIQEWPNGLSPLEQLNTCFEKDYAGVLFWSYNAGDQYSDWADCEAAISTFNDDYGPTIHYDNSCDSVYTETPFLVCNIYPNPVSDFIHLSVRAPDRVLQLELNIINAEGRLLKTYQTYNDTSMINIQDLSAGFYYVKLSVMDEQGKLIQTSTQKVVKI